jgi:hypothetical protein
MVSDPAKLLAFMGILDYVPLDIRGWQTVVLAALSGHYWWRMADGIDTG